MEVLFHHQERPHYVQGNYNYLRFLRPRKTSEPINVLQNCIPPKKLEQKELNLSEMDVLPLIKVEELTLYIIQQEKRIEKIEAINH